MSNPSTFSFSPLIWGTWHINEWNLSDQEGGNFVNQVIDAGLYSIDSADIYGSYTVEEILGRWLQASSRPRDQFQLISKCGIKLVSENRPLHRVKSYDLSSSHIIKSVEHSLSALNTDYLDVLLLHRPSPIMRASEVAEAFHRLHESGKVLHFGVSNFTPQSMDLLQSEFNLQLITNQIELSLLYTSPLINGQMEHAQQYGYPVMAWSPQAGGRLFQHDQNTEAIRRTLDARFGDNAANDLDVWSLAWLLHHPVPVHPILGTSKMDRILKATSAKNLTMSDEDWFALYQAASGREIP